MAGTLNMDTSTGAVLNPGNMIVTGQINALNGIPAATASMVASGDGPVPAGGIAGVATITGDVQLNAAPVSVDAGSELVFLGDTEVENTIIDVAGDVRFDGELTVSGVSSVAVELLRFGNDMSLQASTTFTADDFLFIDTPMLREINFGDDIHVTFNGGFSNDWNPDVNIDEGTLEVNLPNPN